MTITCYEKIIIPQTLEGQNFANKFEKRLRESGNFSGREEDTQSIVIKAHYYTTFTKDMADYYGLS